MKGKSNLKQKLLEFEQLREVVRASTPLSARETPKEKDRRIRYLLSNYDAFCQYYFPRFTVDEVSGKVISCSKFQISAAKKILADRFVFGVLKWPREHAKSVHACLMIPMYLKAHNQLRGMVLVGKNLEAGRRLLSDIQVELEENQRYREDFGEQRGVGNWAEGEFQTKDGVSFIALGRGQSPRGIRNRNRRPDYLVIDDIDDDEIVHNQARVTRVVRWIKGALLGAMNIKGRRVIMAGNRIHRKSILSHIIGEADKDKHRNKGIWVSEVRAIENGVPTWPEKFSLQELQRNIEAMGYAVSQTEYFHNPIIEGKVFKEEWIRWEKLPALNKYDRLICYTDPSFKATATSDYKAVKLWGLKGHEFHLIDCFVRQCSVSTMVKWTYDLYERYLEQAGGLIEFWIEDVFIQDMLLDDYFDEGKLRGYQLPVLGDDRKKPDKNARIISMQPYYERGWVVYNKAKYDDTDFRTAVEHLTAIEQGANTADDSPDADEGAWYFLRQYAAHTTVKSIIKHRPERPY